MEHLTESESRYRNLEKMTIEDILKGINREDTHVALLVKEAIPNISQLVEAIVAKLLDVGRLFYLGAGTSGRLGILDASECPPTFGVSEDKVIGLIAGGDQAIRRAVEFAEDNPWGGVEQLQSFGVNSDDFVIGIAASGNTPYVVGALEWCRSQGIETGCITCNPSGKALAICNHPICIPTGPEFLTGSTRMKAGTAQKMVLNMISTATMIKLGFVMDNKMVDMRLSNQKLWNRGVKILVDTFGIGKSEALLLLQKHGSVRAAIDYLNKDSAK